MSRFLCFCATALLLVEPSNAADHADVRKAMKKATAAFRELSTGGGYLWAYATNSTERWGETKATTTQVWVQPPGTPAAGSAFLQAFRTTADAEYLEAALAAAGALVQGQLESGGWDYVIEFDPQQRRRWRYRLDPAPATNAPAPRNMTTFDDDNTQSALRFLLEVIAAAGDRSDPRLPGIRSALEYGLEKMIEAQYPNGGWPQRYDGSPRDPARFPIVPGNIPENWPRAHSNQNYTGHYTLNDHTQFDCIRTLLDAHGRTRDATCLEAAKRGGDFILLAQLPPPQSGWAQQYNRMMEPAWARAFEPPALSAGESSGALRMLLDLTLLTGDEKYLAPVTPALDWFRRSQIGPNRWARLYELGSNRPIYGDRDGKIHYDLGEISEERRTGYSWEGEYGIPQLMQDAIQLQRLGPVAYHAAKTESRSRTRPANDRVAQILADLNEEGYWVRRGRVEARVFIQNLTLLSAYLGP